MLGFTIYDIVCMSNHVHELYRIPEKVTISKILQLVKGQYSQKFNKRFGRTGHFWRNKPFYRIVENEEYAFNTMTYFHFNPVKAGMVEKPEDWPFSGYQFHIQGNKGGSLGNLLDPLPYAPDNEHDDKKIKTVKKILNSCRRRFIGSDSFIKSMRNEWSRRKASDTYSG